MSASKLVKPAAKYKESFLEALSEFHAEDRYSFLNIEALSQEFDQFIEDINSGQRHLHKPFANWVEPVPETILWFVKGDHYIGSFNIRHRLNWHLEKWGGHLNFVIRPSMRGKGFGKKLLQKGLPCAYYLGIDKALITLDPNHTATEHIIDLCGGEFQDETPQTDQFPARKRYWIACN